jgi:signal transduction histidine kinase
VADRGPGIPPDEQAEIFKPFFRGALAQTMQIRGSGLGLSLVREIVAAHGGTVSVESQKGQGTTFTVRLPLPKK